MKPMRDANRPWSRCRALGAVPALIALLLAPSAAFAVAPDKRADANRAFDARIEHNRAFRAEPAAAQGRAAGEFQRSVPDLAVTYDEATGATRTLTNHAGFLSNEKRSGDASAIAMEWAQANLELLGLTPADLAEYRVARSVYSRLSGVTHVYLEQMLGGIPVYHGVLHVNVAADGRILTVNNQMVPFLAAAANGSTPTLTAADAVAVGARFIGEAASPSELGERSGPQQEV